MAIRSFISRLRCRYKNIGRLSAARSKVKTKIKKAFREGVT